MNQNPPAEILAIVMSFVMLSIYVMAPAMVINPVSAGIPSPTIGDLGQGESDDGKLRLDMAKSSFLGGQKVAVGIINNGNRTNVTFQVVGPDNVTYLIDEVEVGSLAVDVIDPSTQNNPNPSMVIDGAGVPHVIYFDSISGELDYAYLDDGEWNVTSVYDQSPTRVLTSIAVNESDVVHIAFSDSDNDRVMYGVRNGSSWDISEVTTVGGDYTYVDLAFNESGVPYIAFIEFDQDLLLANWTGSAWSIETVDTPPANGFQYPSIAFNQTDEPHIAYRQWNGGWLKHASRSGTSWTVTPLDNDGDCGLGASISIDGDDNPHIGYVSEDTALRHAYWDGDSWETEDVYTSATIAGHQTMALDADDNPHFVFAEDTGGGNEMIYAEWNEAGSNWTIHTFDDVYRNGAVPIVIRGGLTYFSAGRVDTGSMYFFEFNATKDDAQLVFRLPGDAPAGNWTVHGTAEGGESYVNCTFTVKVPWVKEFKIKDVSFPDEVALGEGLAVYVNITNTNNLTKDFYVILQVWDKKGTIIPCRIIQSSIGENESLMYVLTVTVPEDLRTGKGRMEVFLCEDLPSNKGWSLDSRKGKVDIT